MATDLIKKQEKFASTVSRRLAAVVFADVAEFTRLMAKDDAEAASHWRSLRHDILLPQMERHGGRLAQVPGDAVLIEFQSVVSAVSWAVDIQRSIQSQSENPNTVSPIKLRIGINVDDIIDDDGMLLSNGVNIASRIHQVAQPGQIVATQAVCELVRDRLPLHFRDLGTPPLKNIDQPLRLYAVEPGGNGSNETLTQPFLLWSSRPTIAILPLRMVHAGESEQYIGEGITEDIIAGLSRRRSLFVTSHASTLRFANGAENHRSIASALGVRYILQGSMRRRTTGAGNPSTSIRICVELVEAEHERTIWAECFNGNDTDLFEFQDRIVSNIVASLEPRVRKVEFERIRNRPTESLDAYDCVLRALSQLYNFSPQSYEDSEVILKRAIALDPEYAQAHAYLAWRMIFWIGDGLSRDVKKDREFALTESRRAVTLDPDDAFALAIRGHVIAFLDRRPSEASDLLEQALHMDPNSSLAWALSSLSHAYCGRGNEARQRLQNVWQLTPFDPMNFFFWIAAGIAEFVEGRFDEAVFWLRKSQRANPRFVACKRILAAALAQNGNLEEAQAAGRSLLDAEPNFSISHYLSWYPLQRHRDRNRLEDGLRLAKLPD
ncbi:adenylate/guanylate cyclase domain-containing protein [Roseibium sp. RKSG952]|uniref:adenylate/guanylate cyclase domain-containing protein n=1 Tax=Roseibium sp. RKSG952 TaxID=2529384 RepID=UPI0018AD2598|nr:adenylate/guanylate cyclase domain-containing protein [Roseibium sp. RKSG952]